MVATRLFEEKQQLFDAMFRSWKKKKCQRGTKAQLYHQVDGRSGRGNSM
jgi:hypothetical protein